MIGYFNDLGQKARGLAQYFARGSSPVLGVELSGAGRLAMERAVVQAIQGLDAGMRRTGEEWFGHALQTGWTPGSHATRSTESLLASWEVDCEALGATMAFGGKIMGSLQESDGWDRPRVRVFGVRCEATLAVGGAASVGSFIHAVDRGMDEDGLRRVALLSMARSVEAALPGLDGQPGFHAARRAAKEAGQLAKAVGGAGRRSQGSRKRSL